MDEKGKRMSKVDEGLRILGVLVEPAGGSIEAVRQTLHKNDTDVTGTDNIAQLEALFDIAIDGFFHCAAHNVTFTDVRRIKEFYGRTLEDAYPGASATFMKLARAYWTFKVALMKCVPHESVCINLLQKIDVNFAGVFFPTPGPFRPPKKLREKTMRTLIEQSGANFDVEDYIRSNFYLR
jgi:hypothetical protein